METFYGVVREFSLTGVTFGYHGYHWEQRGDLPFLFTVQVTHEKVRKPQILDVFTFVFLLFKCA